MIIYAVLSHSYFDARFAVKNLKDFTNKTRGGPCGTLRTVDIEDSDIEDSDIEDRRL